MPILESNLLYEAAQQLNPWRAGTPGRAPRNWQAVVCFRRPLSLFICVICFGALAQLGVPTLASAQLFPTKPSLQLRLGGFIATPLVNDAVSSRALDDSIPGARANEIVIKQQPGPIGTLALRLPLRSSTQLEVSASVARSKVRGDDGLVTWDVTSATIGNFVLGFGYLYRGAVAVRAGIGVTRLFAEDRALFSKGNSMKPLLEAGAATAIKLGSRPIDLDLRVQSHSYTTATLRDSGGSGGNVLRAVLQIGTTLWQVGGE